LYKTFNMKKSIKIAVPKPCEKQEWSSEFISNKEQMCLLCSEKVYDATTLSDNELHKLINQKDRPKCMKFKQSQLNRPLGVSSYQFNYKQLSSAFCSLLVAGLVVSCAVQKVPEKESVNYEQLFKTDAFFNDTLKNVVRGVVLNFENEPISNAFVSVEGTSKGVKADEKGYFKYEIPHYVLSDTMTLKIQAVYKQKWYYNEFTITRDSLPLNNIFETEEEYSEVLLGIYRTID